MAIWEKPGHEDAIMLARLQRYAEGYDSEGNPISREMQLQAIAQWQEIRRHKQLTKNDTLRAENDRLRAESDQMRAENDRLRAVAEVEVLRADAFSARERIQIEKADVVVRALEAAAKSGAAPEQVLATIQDLSSKLLSGPSSAQEVRALEGPRPLALEDHQHQGSEEDVPAYERMRRRRRKKK